MRQISLEEIKAQLHRLPTESSPGPDGLSYCFWKSLPNGGCLLKVIFNICLYNGKILSSWKRSNMILIHKKDDPKDPANWRPISLQSTLYKIFAAVLAHRLAIYCMDNGTISPFQKGFVPFEGCFEHSFLMHSLLEDSKRGSKDLRLVWFDLKNAFGSIPHGVLLHMMSRLSLPKAFNSLCQNIYDNSTSRIRSSSGFTKDIPQLMGVKQGCPLSPLLFNLAIQGMLHGIDRVDGGYKLSPSLTIKYLAYADDLCIVAHSKEDINNFITVMTNINNIIT